jgi:hypothetical protein
VEQKAGPARVDETRERLARTLERVTIVEGITVLLDGNPATLIDLSVCGAQVTTTATLKPNQRVRLSLPTSSRVRISATVRWANFEIPAGGPCYRAGLKFIDPDQDAIAEFIETHKQR